MLKYKKNDNLLKFTHATVTCNLFKNNYLLKMK